MTPNEKSLIKARYFCSILKVAKQTDEALALRMIQSLVNDTTTDGVSPHVLAAEETALRAARYLSSSLATRERNVVAAWNNALHTATQWLQLL